MFARCPLRLAASTQSLFADVYTEPIEVAFKRSTKRLIALPNGKTVTKLVYNDRLYGYLSAWRAATDTLMWTP